MQKIVSNQIIPHFTYADSLHALKQISHLRRKQDLDFSPFFGTRNYLLTNAARTALSKIIDVIKPPKNKKIGLPAFICAVVATPFLAKGYNIQWIDTDENGLLSYDDFLHKADEISVLVAPHIFGQTLALEKFHAICQKKNIFLIEDGAHFFKPVSSQKNWHCDARLLSFGREKVLSCVSGGAMLWPEDSPYADSFSRIFLRSAKTSWTLRHLLQPITYASALPWWKIGGKLIPWFALKTKLLPLAVTGAETQGQEDFPVSQMPYALQAVLWRQFIHQEEKIFHQKKMAQQWQNVLTKLFPGSKIIIPKNTFRVILKTPDRKTQQSILRKAQKSGFYLRDWDGKPIAPKSVQIEKFGYTPGQCPNAEQFAQTYITFPTNLRTTEADIARFERLFRN